MAANVYELINGRITELLESGTIPWKKPWNGSGSLPVNLVSRKGYRGVNAFLLACQPYGSPYWLTYKQCLDLGGQVRHGSKSTPVVFWKMVDREKEGESESSDGGRSFILRYYNVFNSEQCEGLDIPATEESGILFTPIERAELVVLGMQGKPEISHGGDRAFYSPMLDAVRLPHQEAFNSAEEYYSTLFHELVHSTGHASRLARKSILEPSYFGSHEYSKEELVAEMGAAFLCGHADIANHTIENSAAYIQGWLKALKSDKTLLVHAAAAAQKASDFILNT